MVLLAAVADSAERAIENNVMVLDNSSTGTVKGNFFMFHILRLHLKTHQKCNQHIDSTINTIEIAFNFFNRAAVLTFKY